MLRNAQNEVQNISSRDMLNYMASMDHIEYGGEPIIYRSGPFDVGEVMSDFDEFGTLGPLPPRADENQDQISDSSQSPFGESH